MFETRPFDVIKEIKSERVTHGRVLVRLHSLEKLERGFVNGRSNETLLYKPMVTNMRIEKSTS